MADATSKKDKRSKKLPAEEPIEAIIADQITDAEAAEVIEEKHEAKTHKAEPTAKAGKRSAKAIAEAEADAEKEERKASNIQQEIEDADKPKQHSNPTRSRLERQGKNFRKVAEQIETGKAYNLADALSLATKTSPVKFDATVELHINLNVDPRHADQNIRDNFVLPQGTGKTIRVAVFADVDDAAKAIAAGADIAGIDEVTKILEKGSMDFDTLIATPSQMAKLGKYARTLGPRGLMPNPKSGTVTADVAKAVKEAKAGRVEYRVDSTGIVHLGIGKVSFGVERLSENAQASLASIKGNKPASVKSNYVKAIHMSTSMGPSITIETSAAN
jgi:large subunit ribosomal protein L1